MANKARGEVTVSIGEESYTLRPTFEAMEQIEDKLKLGIPELVDKFSRGEVQIREVVTILHEGIVAQSGGKRHEVLSRSELGAQVLSAGLMGIIKQPAMIRFLLHGIAGDKKMESAGEPTPVPPERTET